jgi:hypothetical protein
MPAEGHYLGCHSFDTGAAYSLLLPVAVASTPVANF